MTHYSHCEQMNVVLLLWEGHELCIECFRDQFPVAYQNLANWMRVHATSEPARGYPQ